MCDLENFMSLYVSGCGASCVYPLVGSKKNGWTFLASEADSMNYEFAKRNVEKNSQQEKITGACFTNILPELNCVHLMCVCVRS